MKLTQLLQTTLKPRLLETGLTEIATQKIINTVVENFQIFNFDLRWAEHINFDKSEEFQEISMDIGPRDLGFDMEGNLIHSGMFMIPMTPPWEKQNN